MMNVSAGVLHGQGDARNSTPTKRASVQGTMNGRSIKQRDAINFFSCIDKNDSNNKHLKARQSFDTRLVGVGFMLLGVLPIVALAGMLTAGVGGGVATLPLVFAISTAALCLMGLGTMDFLSVTDVELNEYPD